MTTHRRNPAQAITAWAGRRLRASRNDDGFFLLESIVAIAIITIIMAALTAFFSNAVKSNNEARQRQVAVQVADSALDSLRALPATDLVTDRDQTDVLAQFQATYNTPVASWVLGTASTASGSTVMKPIFDPTAVDGDGVSAVVPTAPKVTTVNGLDYNVSKYVGSCAVLGGAANGNVSSCLPGNVGLSNVNAYYRGVVAVTWSSTHCPGGTCTFVTATLLTGAVDPTFNLNQSPAPLPVAVSPGNQTSVVGDTISNVAFTMKDGTGVPTATWTTTSTLPAGITLNPDGTLTGSPTAATGSAVTINATLTDGFLRTSTASLTWNVLPKLTATAPADQSSFTGNAIPTLTLTASGGSGTPYTWADPTGSLPPGLTLTTSSNQGKITGTPTAVGTYPVSVTVTDPTKHSVTLNWTWTVGTPPIVVTNPGSTTSTQNAATTLKLTQTGATGTVTWTASGLPAGLTLNSTTGVISGTPTTTGVSNVTVKASDAGSGASDTETFTWTIAARPTVAAPADPNSTAGGAESFQLVTTCPNAPCTYALTNGPTGLSISATGAVSGSVTSGAAVYTAAKITVTDASNVSVSTATFTWTVNAAPSVAVPTQTTLVNTKVSLSAASFVTGGTAPISYTASGLPAWLTLNKTTGAITGTSPTTKSSTTGITITATDANNVSATSASFKWVVSDLQLAIPDQWASPSTATSFDIDTYLSGGTTPVTITAPTLPSWLTYNSTSHVISGTAPSTKTQVTISVTVSDSAGASVTDTFIWYVSSLRLTFGDQVTPASTAVSPDIDSYVSGGTASTITVSGLPSWLTYNSTSHVISGTSPASATPTTGIVLTIKDSSGFSFTRTLTWYVSAIKWSGEPTSASVTSGTAANYGMAAYVSGATAPNTYFATGLPANWKIDPATGTITSSGTTTTGTYTIYITVTDSTGAFATTPAITLTVTP